MALRARKVSGAFEKRAPDLKCYVFKWLPLFKILIFMKTNFLAGKPRARGLTGKDIFYEKGAVLDAEENRELEFKSLVSAQPCSLPWKIMEKAKKFICACLNNDRKGIIYFGVGDSQEQGSKYKHGEILGLEVEDIKDDINKAFQLSLMTTSRAMLDLFKREENKIVLTYFLSRSRIKEIVLTCT